MCEKAVENYLWCLRYVSDWPKTVEMCERTIEKYPYNPCMLRHVPDHLKTLEMCERAVEKYRQAIEFISDHLKTQKACERVAEKYPYNLAFIPDYFKTQEMCNEAVQKRQCLLEYIPDWFVTQHQIKIWHDDDGCYHDDKLIGWYNDYKKRRILKASIKEELLPISWHPLRYWDWCVSEDEKRGTDKLWV